MQTIRLPPATMNYLDNTLQEFFLPCQVDLDHQMGIGHLPEEWNPPVNKNEYRTRTPAIVRLWIVNVGAPV